MTVAEALRDAARRLKAVSDTSRLDAELLMAHALGVGRSDMLLHMTRDAAKAPDAFFDLLERRAAHEPVAYIVGRQEFYGRSFRVTPDVLIPRADSECLVTAALKAVPGAHRVLDCGVGSGALLVTYLLEVPAAQGAGIDCSQVALFVAENNAQRYRIGRERGKFLHRDWNEPGWARDLGKFDLILANPPYVEEGAELSPSVREYEPAEALFSGPEGLDDYRILIPQLPDLLAYGGIACLEIGAFQAGAVTEIAEAAGFSVEIVRDLGDRTRVAILRLGLGKGREND